MPNTRLQAVRAHMRAYRKPVDGLAELTTEYGTAGTLPGAFGRRTGKNKPCNVSNSQTKQKQINQTNGGIKSWNFSTAQLAYFRHS